MQYHRVAVISGRGSAPHEFQKIVYGIALDRAGRVYAVGDRDVKVFTAKRELERRWETAKPGHSVAVDEDGTVYVGEAGQLEIFDADGKLQATWQDRDRLGLVTAISLCGEYVFLADSKARCIRRFDRQGRALSDIGQDNRTRGFVIPNGHLDFCIDPQGVIHAANPGKHRVERYSSTGELLGWFGKFGMYDPADFRGCCNPTNVALTGDGHLVVTEKAEPRTKVYDAKAKLMAVVAEDAFDPNCRNMDVAVDQQGRIYVADTVRLQICVFAALQSDPSPPSPPPQGARGDLGRRAFDES